VLLSQVPSKTINIRFTPIRKIIRRAGDRDKDIKEIVAGVSDTLLKELESIIRLSISKI
jgi:histone H3/H4